MPESQFDTLASLYEEFSMLPFRRNLEFPSVLALTGDLTGKRVLDLGCGSGVYSRLLASAYGAGVVTGLDDSRGMIDHARRREGRERLGIRYESSPLPPELAGSFDLVLGVYVLPYATTYEGLTSLCRTACQALRPGGRFLTLPVNPGFHPDPGYYRRYGFRLYAERPLGDGSPVGLNLLFGSHDVRITARHWSEETLGNALRDAGFSGCRRHSHRLADQVADRAFYQPYLDVPHAIILETTKKETEQ